MHVPARDSEERWRPVAGFEGLYEVSDRGRVRSLGRIDALGRQRAPRLLTLHPDTEGYLRARLAPHARDGVASKGIHRRVNVLVLEAFHGPRPAGHESCHENDIPHDNRLMNLRWGTPKANRIDGARNRARLTMVNRGRRRRAAHGEGHCSRGHRLVEPNLTNPHPSRGGRRCLACQRGHNSVKDARRASGQVLALQEEADRHYQLIMQDSATQ